MAEQPGDVDRDLAGARAGSADALGQALESCRNYLLLVAAQELGDDLQAKAGASDLVQETFLEAQRDFGRFNGNSEAELLAWLRQILVNNVASFSRRFRAAKREIGREVVLQGDDSARPGDALLVDPQRTPSTDALEREQAASLRRAIQQLPEDYRQVIMLRYMESRTFEEIGALMNRTGDATRKLWLRAMEKLRQEWDESP